MRRLPGSAFAPLVVTVDDPLRFYYNPLTSYFYWKRLGMAHDTIRRLPRARRCLEVACGSGVFLASLAAFCDELHAVDLGADLKCVRSILRGAGVPVHVQRADICRLPYASGSFDIVVGMSCMEHLRDPELAVSEARRVLRDGGTAVFGVPIDSGLLNLFFKLVGFDHEGVHVSTHEDVLRAAKQAFEDVELRLFPPGLPRSRALYMVIKGTR